ncbi:MAG: hypothetical protein AB7R89_18205 [Dehalococcoidia bacterium]
MADEQRERPALRLEGIVLCDGDGALYEVPYLVIERYRVSTDREKELTIALADERAMSGDRGGEADGGPWAVRGGIYASASASDATAAGRFPDPDQYVRAFDATRHTPILRCVVRR